MRLIFKRNPDILGSLRPHESNTKKDVNNHPRGDCFAPADLTVPALSSAMPGNPSLQRDIGPFCGALCSTKLYANHNTLLDSRQYYIVLFVRESFGLDNLCMGRFFASAPGQDSYLRSMSKFLGGKKCRIIKFASP